VYANEYLVKDLRELPRVSRGVFGSRRAAVRGQCVDLPSTCQRLCKKRWLDRRVNTSVTNKTQAWRHAYAAPRQARGTRRTDQQRIADPSWAAGHHWPGAPSSLPKIADRGNIPVTTTLPGPGGLRLARPKRLYMIGHAMAARLRTTGGQECDLLSSVVRGFDDRVTATELRFAP